MSNTVSTPNAPQPESAAGGQRPGGTPHPPRPGNVVTALGPLVIDVGIPLGSYYLLHAALGASVWLSLALSSLGPAARSAWGLTAGRRINVLALLMVSVNLAGIVVSFLTGDPRAMIAKDSVVSSVIAFAILGSIAARRLYRPASRCVPAAAGDDGVAEHHDDPRRDLSRSRGRLRMLDADRDDGLR